MNHDKSSAAFTIVELMIVIVVVAVLATIGILTYQGIQVHAKNTTIISALSSTFKLLDIQNKRSGDYRGDVGGVPGTSPGGAYSIGHPLNNTADSNAIISEVTSRDSNYKLSHSAGFYYTDSSYAMESINSDVATTLNSRIPSIYTTSTYVTDDAGIANYAAQLKYILVDPDYSSPASAAGYYVAENDSVLPQKKSYAVITALFHGRQSCPDINGKPQLQTKPNFSNYAKYYPIKSSANFTACHYLLGELG